MYDLVAILNNFIYVKKYFDIDCMIDTHDYGPNVSNKPPNITSNDLLKNGNANEMLV